MLDGACPDPLRGDTGRGTERVSLPDPKLARGVCRAHCRTAAAVTIAQVTLGLDKGLLVRTMRSRLWQTRHRFSAFEIPVVCQKRLTTTYVGFRRSTVVPLCSDKPLITDIASLIQ